MADYPNNLLQRNTDHVYPNAFFDYITRLLPKQLKVLFVWLEYLYVNCGQIFATIKKFSEYPITEITVISTNKKLKEKAEYIIKKVIKLKGAMILSGLDYFIYGNSFISVYKPFNRFLVCKSCKAKHNAKKISYDWRAATFEYVITCESCKTKGPAIVLNEKSRDITRLKIIRWDAKNIDISSNPITEECEYYYNIPKDIVDRVTKAKPDKFLLDTLPWEFLQTIKEKKIFKFSPGALYHLKAPSPSGINKEWGFPGLLSSMKPFFYTAILRKANEAIALEHIIPMRILFPQGTSSNNDPTQYVSLARWRDELEGAIRKWRKDPNHIKFSPIPVGVQNMGGDGRAMLTLAEVQAAEENIVVSSGVPKEFIYGGMSTANGSVNLRMIENQMFTYIEQLKEMAQWICDDALSFCGLDKVEIDMTDFKLVDDIQQRQLVLTYGTNGQMLSKDSLSKVLQYDLNEEREKIYEEALEDTKLQLRIEDGQRKIQTALSQKVKGEQSGNPLNYDPVKVMEAAQSQANQLIQVPMEQRKSMLLQLKQQDPVLHAVVIQQLSELHKMQREQGDGAVSAAAGVSNVKPAPVQ